MKRRESARTNQDLIRFRRGLHGAASIAFWMCALTTAGVANAVSQRGGFIDEGGWFLLLLSLGFTLAGLGRQGVRIDLARRQVAKWWGICVPWLWDLPFRRKDRPLDDFGTVLLSHDIWNRSNRGGTTVYVVSLLVGDHDVDSGEPGSTAERVVLEGNVRYLTSRKRAESLANRLDIGVLDETGRRGSEYRPAGSLDEPYSWRSSWADELIEPPVRPAETRSTYRSEQSTAILDLASRPTGMIWIVTSVGLLIPPAFVIATSVHWAVAMALIIPPAALAWVKIVPTLVKDRLEVSPEGIKVTRLSLLGRRRYQIPADALEELVSGRHVIRSIATIDYIGEVISIRSDSRVVEVGAGLGRSEQDWILATMRTHLLGLD